MLAHYLLTLYRSLSRHRLYAAINVLGLAVGIAVFLVLFLDVRFETSFERWIPNADQIYGVRTSYVGSQASLGGGYYTMGGLWPELRADYPKLSGTRIRDYRGSVRDGAKITPETFEKVDPTFFQVFDLPLIAGDKANVLHAPDDVVLTQAKAHQYFGDADPMGRRLTLAFDGAVQVYRVAGVLKDHTQEHRADARLPCAAQGSDGRRRPLVAPLGQHAPPNLLEGSRGPMRPARWMTGSTGSPIAMACTILGQTPTAPSGYAPILCSPCTCTTAAI